MDGKWLFDIGMALLFFCETACVLLAGSVVGCAFAYCFLLFALVVMVFALRSGDRAARLSYIRLVVFSTITLLAVVLSAKRVGSLNVSLPRGAVVSVEGTLIEDSSFSENGNHTMKVALERCTDIYGDSGSASGVVTVIGDRRYVLTYGMKVSLQGCFRDGLFICRDLQVLRRSIFNDVRERLIGLFERRLVPPNAQDSDLLSCALVIGRTDEGSVPLVGKARSCGCSHVFVLSGMHLGILALICRKLFGKRTLGRVVSIIAVAGFVFIAGPRPSLVRAALLFALSFIPIEERILVCMLVQLVMFPYSVMSLGFCYSYMAILALVYICPYIDVLLAQIHLKVLGPFSKTLCILVLSIPVQIAKDGLWYPSGIVASPIMGILAGISMALGLMVLVFGRVALVVKLNGLVYGLMEKVLDMFGLWGEGHWGGYLIVLSSFALLLVIAYMQRRCVRRRCSCCVSVIDLESVPNVNSEP